MRTLLDTNVVSEAMSKRADPRVLRWLDALDPDDAWLSAMTVGEIERGIQRIPESRRRRQLETWLEEDILVRFEGRILPLDTDAFRAWGRLLAKLEAKGRVLPLADSLLAAQALHHGCRIATRNGADFAGTGVAVVDPWVG